MHELSIATSLVTLACDAAADAGNPPIEAVCIRVGDAAGVVIEALEFAWDEARAGTACAAARLEIERVPVRIRCDTCAGEVELDLPLRFRCPRCGGPASHIVTGKELDLVALEVADDVPATPPNPPPNPTETIHATTHP